MCTKPCNSTSSISIKQLNKLIPKLKLIFQGLPYERKHKVRGSNLEAGELPFVYNGITHSQSSFVIFGETPHFVDFFSITFRYCLHFQLRCTSHCIRIFIGRVKMPLMH